MTTNTIRLHRIFKAPPEKVYRAFLEADALAKWLPPHGFCCRIDHLDPKEGGTYRMAFRNFTSGQSHGFGGEYLELIPAQKIRYTDKFDDPNLPGEILVSLTFSAVPSGTELNVIQDGVPAVIPADACYLGWQESLEQLAHLVEPEIPN